MGEITVRIFFPQDTPVKWFERNERYGKFHKKNYKQNFYNKKTNFIMEVKTNSLGLRDREYDLSDPLAKKILLLGDSFTFGWGLNVESIFATKLEFLLNNSEKKYFVINAGVADWGTIQEVTYARDHFTTFNPDFIVLTFCGNDLWDNNRFKEQLENNFQGILYFPGKAFLRKYSHLFRFIRDKWWVLSENISVKKTIKRSKENNQQVHFDEQTAYVLKEEDWNETLKLIRDFHKDFIDFNPGGILLIQATAPWSENIRSHLSAMSNGKNLIYVDLFEDTLNLLKHERRLEYDGHWSEEMHTIAARKLYANIKEIENGFFNK